MNSKGLTELEFIEVTTQHQPNTFAVGVEKYVREHDVSYIDGVIGYSDEHEIELDIVPKLINITLKQKLEAEARALNLLPRTTSLPI